MKSDLKSLQEYIKKVGVERGYSGVTVPELFLLLAEEVGEMAKAVRQKTKLYTDSSHDEQDNLDHEMADVLSYILDIANHLDVDLEKAFWEKEEINNKRKWNKKGE